MGSRYLFFRFISILICVVFLSNESLFSQALKETPELDKKVRAVLEDNRGRWYDMNVPASDGQVLHNLILKHGYTRALEIGTSTGHSGIWIAWALAKTGGKLITIEIDDGEVASHTEVLESSDAVIARRVFAVWSSGGFNLAEMALSGFLLKVIRIHEGGRRLAGNLLRGVQGEA